MSAMPAGRKWKLLFRFEIDEVDSVFPETKRNLDRFDEPGGILSADRQPVLDHLHPRPETNFFRRLVYPNDFAVQPDAEITLLLQELEKVIRVGFRRNCHPKSDESSAVRILRRNL